MLCPGVLHVVSALEVNVMTVFFTFLFGSLSLGQLLFRGKHICPSSTSSFEEVVHRASLQMSKEAFWLI